MVGSAAISSLGRALPVVREQCIAMVFSFRCLDHNIAHSLYGSCGLDVPHCMPLRICEDHQRVPDYAFLIFGDVNSVAVVPFGNLHARLSSASADKHRNNDKDQHRQDCHRCEPVDGNNFLLPLFPAPLPNFLLFFAVLRIFCRFLTM